MMSPTKDRRDFSSHEEFICTLPKSVATPPGQDCRPPSRPTPAAFGTCRNILQCAHESGSLHYADLWGGQRDPRTFTEKLPAADLRDAATMRAAGANDDVSSARRGDQCRFR